LISLEFLRFDDELTVRYRGHPLVLTCQAATIWSGRSRPAEPVTSVFLDQRGAFAQFLQNITFLKSLPSLLRPLPQRRPGTTHKFWLDVRVDPQIAPWQNSLKKTESIALLSLSSVSLSSFTVLDFLGVVPDVPMTSR
jgi:hypothetical protein